MPRDHVQRRVIDFRAPQPAQKLRNDLKFAVAILVGGSRVFEIARIGQTVGADGAEFGQSERQAVVFADVAASLLFLSTTRNLTPRGITHISPGVASRMPSSVWKPSAPNCGTMSNSPSAQEKNRSCMEALAA